MSEIDTEVDRLRAELKVARALHVAAKERDEARAQVKAWQSEELSRRAERDEARRERDEALSRVAAEAGKDLAGWAADLDAAEAAHARVVAERDEARAEVERLRREREALVEAEQRLFARVLAELSHRVGHPSDSTR